MQTVAAYSLFVAGQLFSISLDVRAVKLLSVTHPYCNKTPCKRMQWKERNYLFFFPFCENCQSAEGLSQDTVLLHLLFQDKHLPGQTPCSRGTVVQGLRNSLALKDLEVSLPSMAQGPAGTFPSLPLTSPGLIEPPRTEDLLCPSFFLCLSMIKARGRQRNLPFPKEGKTAAVLKTIRKTKAQTLSP